MSFNFTHLFAIFVKMSTSCKRSNFNFSMFMSYIATTLHTIRFKNSSVLIPQDFYKLVFAFASRC